MLNSVASMAQAKLEFFGNLRDFSLSSEHIVDLKDHPQLKDAIESCRVPHCEVGAALVNGSAMVLSAMLKDGDFVQIFPQINPILPNQKFLVDCNLGKLNSLLRSLGFDCFYENDISDERILDIAEQEERMVFTKDRRLLMRKRIKNGYFVRSVFPRDQVIEVLKRFSLQSQINLLSRCIDCNIETERVEKEEILHKLEPLTQKYYNEFNRCPSCGKIFWRGTHFERIKIWADQLAVVT